MINNKKPEHKNQASLIEYQKAQDSAEHHDTLTWQVSAIILAALSILLGAVIQNYQNLPLRIVVLCLIVSLALIISLFIFILNFRYYKNLAYFICKRIERDEKFIYKYHLFTDEDYVRLPGDMHKNYKIPLPPRPCIKQWPTLCCLLAVFGIIFGLLVFIKLIFA